MIVSPGSFLLVAALTLAILTAFHFFSPSKATQGTGAHLATTIPPRSSPEVDLEEWLAEPFAEDEDDHEENDTASRKTRSSKRNRKKTKQKKETKRKQQITATAIERRNTSTSLLHRTRRRNTTVILSSNQRKHLEMQKLKPTEAALGRIRDVVENIADEIVILSAATLSYRDLAFNWIHHLEKLKITNYGVLCFDEAMFRYIGPEHAFLMSNAGLNYTDSDGSATAQHRNKKSAADKDRKAKRALQLPLPVLEERARERRSKYDNDTSISVQPLARRRLSKLQNLEPYSMQQTGKLKKSRSNPFIDGATRNAMKRAKSKRRSSTNKRSNSSEEEILARRRDKMLERRGKTNKIRATSTHFTAYQLAKFDAIDVVLSMNKTVIWSDTDAVWMDRCAYDMLREMPPGVDVAGQRALFPTTLSLVTGACLCSGFFMIRPTPASLSLLKSVRTMLLANEDDQSALNKALLDLGAFYYGYEVAEVPSVSSRGTSTDSVSMLGAVSNVMVDLGVIKGSPGVGQPMTRVRRKRKAVYNSTAIQYTSAPAVKKIGVASKLSSSLSLVAINKTIQLALLPYHKFPRGQVAVPITQAMTREEKSEYRLLIRRTRNETLAARRNRTTSSHSPPIESELHEQAIEWRKFARGACVWHIISAKEGPAKVLAMQRDGVYGLTAAAGWKYAGVANSSFPYEVAHVRKFLYGG